MFRLLSDTEVALNELLVACRESIDHYQDATELIERPDLRQTFLNIIKNRKLFLARLESAIREFGDLPAVPDPDKEASEMALHHLSAAVSTDYTDEILAQRISGEEYILTLNHTANKTEANESCIGLLNDLSKHINETIDVLTSFK